MESGPCKRIYKLPDGMKTFPLYLGSSLEFDKDVEIMDANKMTNTDTATDAKIIPLYLIAQRGNCRVYFSESM